MKKIAVIPLLYDEINYGGVLQFYALQKILKQQEYEVNILQVNNETFVIPRKEIHSLSFKGRIARMLFYPKRKKNERILKYALEDRKAKVKQFKAKHYSNVVDLSYADLKSYDAFICGSDQIWNPTYARQRHFLAFAPDDSNKIIYAASLGTESITEKQAAYMKPYIDGIRHVSVREHSGKKLLDSFCQRNDIEVVLDPTLLLTKDEWCSILPREQRRTNDYVFTYFLGSVSEETKNTIRDYARKNELRVINVAFASGEKVDLDFFGDVNLKNLGPEEFLSYIKEARAVFTDSFHACVFSILFNTVFYVFERKTTTNMNGRIHTLHQNFHIESRFVTATHPIDEIAEQIDFSRIAEYQNTLRQKSIDFLLESIQNEE